MRLFIPEVEGISTYLGFCDVIGILDGGRCSLMSWVQQILVEPKMILGVLAGTFQGDLGTVGLSIRYSPAEGGRLAVFHTPWVA